MGKESGEFSVGKQLPKQAADRKALMQKLFWQDQGMPRRLMYHDGLRGERV